MQTIVNNPHPTNPIADLSLIWNQIQNIINESNHIWHTTKSCCNRPCRYYNQKQGCLYTDTECAFQHKSIMNPSVPPSASHAQTHRHKSRSSQSQPPTAIAIVPRKFRRRRVKLKQRAKSQSLKLNNNKKQKQKQFNGKRSKSNGSKSCSKKHKIKIIGTKGASDEPCYGGGS